MYADDNDDYLVPSYWSWSLSPYPQTWYANYWWYRLVVENAYLEADVLVCPGDELPADWAFHSPNRKYPSSLSEHLPISYGYAGTIGNGYWGHTVGEVGFNHRRIGDFNRDRASGDPTRAFVLFEWNNVPVQNGTDGSLNGNANTKVQGDWRKGNFSFSARHRGGFDTHAAGLNYQGVGNFAFVDGHAESLRAPFCVANYGDYDAFTDNWDYAGNGFD